MKNVSRLFCYAMMAIWTFSISSVEAQSPTQMGANAAKQAKHLLHRTWKTAGRTAHVAANATASTLKKLAMTPIWAKLQMAYAYPKGSPQVKETPKQNEEMMQINLELTGANGKPVEGVFLRPKPDGKYPCALVLHGLTSNKEAIIKLYGLALVKKGVAVLALDAPGHGKQRVPGKNMWTEAVIAPAVREGDRNYRIALDYLGGRNDIDTDRIGLLGYSMGAIMGSILGAVDDRVKYFALCAGGDPFLPIARTTVNDTHRGIIMRVSPSLFIGHISPRPLLMCNGLEDPVVVPPAARLLQMNALPPREVVWYNGTHDVPLNIRQKAVDWLADKLKAQSNQNSAPANPLGTSSGQSQTLNGDEIKE